MPGTANAQDEFRPDSGTSPARESAQVSSAATRTWAQETGSHLPGGSPALASAKARPDSATGAQIPYFSR